MKNLKKLRLEHKFTQAELARALNLARSTLCFYEKGEREPDINTMINIAKFFNVTVDYLLGIEPNPRESISLEQCPKNQSSSFYEDVFSACEKMTAIQQMQLLSYAHGLLASKEKGDL